MYAELLKEFQGSIKEKEQAAQLQKPATPVKEKPAPKLDFNLFGDPVPEKPVAKPKTEPKQEELIPVKIDETLKPKLKVVGKIELEKAEEKSLPQEEPVIEPPVEVITPPVAPQELPIPSASEEITRIKAPELKGLKILGKIDTNKLKEKETRKKDERKPNTPDTAKPNTNSAADAEKKKRKRKRKKIGTQEVGSGQNQGNRAKTGAGGGGYKKEEAPKEISQKQIEEKIKATMARLNVGGKNKRQKIRRDKREEMREKAELAEAASDRSKIQLTEFVTVQELSNLMDVPVIDVITTCMNMGIIVSINQRLDAEVIEISVQKKQ